MVQLKACSNYGLMFNRKALRRGDAAVYSEVLLMFGMNERYGFLERSEYSIG